MFNGESFKKENRSEGRGKSCLKICEEKWPEKIELFKKATEYVDRIWDIDKNKELYQKMVQEIQRMKKSDSSHELNKCLLYHYLIGSTPIEAKIEYFDLEGEKSILNLMEKLVTEYEKSEQPKKS